MKRTERENNSHIGLRHEPRDDSAEKRPNFIHSGLSTSTKVLHHHVSRTDARYHCLKTNLASELGNDDVLTVLLVPVLDIGNQILRISVVEVESHVGDLRKAFRLTLMLTSRRYRYTKLTVHPPLHAARKSSIHCSPRAEDVTAGDQSE